MYPPTVLRLVRVDLHVAGCLTVCALRKSNSWPVFAQVGRKCCLLHVVARQKLRKCLAWCCWHPTCSSSSRLLPWQQPPWHHQHRHRHRRRHRQKQSFSCSVTTMGKNGPHDAHRLSYQHSCPQSAAHPMCVPPILGCCPFEAFRHLGK